MRVKRAWAAAAAVAVLLVGGCAEDEPAPAAEPGRVDCDREDLAGYERDCGYWGPGGVFVVWVWVDVARGVSVAPPGWRRPRRPPAGGSWDRPQSTYGGKVTTSRQQQRPPTGGGASPTAVPRTTPTPGGSNRAAPSRTPQQATPRQAPPTPGPATASAGTAAPRPR